MKPLKLLVPLSAILALGACASASPMERRIEDLETQKQDLARRNQELLADYTACRARCDALQRRIRDMKPKAGVRGGQYDLPDSMRRQGMELKKTSYGEIVIDVPSVVFFGSGVSKLSTGGRKALQSVGQWIRARYPDAMIRVDGHSDSDPIRRTKSKYHCNWDLSLERAHSVLHQMIDQMGFDPKKVTVAGYGPHRPKDARNKSKNRRVEIVIYQAPGK